jgi:hypothetical protein
LRLPNSLWLYGHAREHIDSAFVMQSVDSDSSGLDSQARILRPWRSPSWRAATR